MHHRSYVNVLKNFNTFVFLALLLYFSLIYVGGLWKLMEEFACVSKVR